MEFKLGKLDHKHDDRTLMMARFLAPVRVPSIYDFDKGRRPFPWKVWKNDELGDCVIAGRANQQLRLERIEQRRTIGMRDVDVVNEYFRESGGQDSGLVMLDAQRSWRNEGWTVNGRNYKIAAYGEVEPQDFDQLRSGIYVLHGMQYGFSLPIAAQAMTHQGVWDYNGETGSEWQPGSWGGHCAYGKSYRRHDEFPVITWGREVVVTGNFIKKYCDEAWVVVDNLDPWSHSNTLDVKGLTAALHQISGKVDE